MDLKRHDEYSSAMRNLLLSSINAMGDCFILFDETCTIVYTNRAAGNIFRFKIGDVCCDEFERNKIHDATCSLFKAIERSTEFKIIEAIPISFVKDWESYAPKFEEDICELTFESIYTPIFDSERNFWGCIKLSRNLTHNRCLENRLKKLIIEHTREASRSKDKLDDYLRERDEVQQQLINSEKLLSLGKLSRGITHEIFNSLSVLGPKIKMFGTYLDKILVVLEEYKKLHQLEDPVAIKEQLQRISRMEKSDRGINFYTEKLQKFIAPCNSELYSIEKIVESLNEFTNLQKPEFGYVNINDELESTLILLEYEFTNNKIEIVKRYDQSLKEVPCHPAEINQVFLNVMTNSIESLKEKSSKTEDFEPMIKITTKRDDDHAIISIFDNGSGFKREDIDQIFDPFFTTKSPTVNAGLGLSTAFTIIEKQHGGKIEAKTEPGEFAEIVLKLPLTDDPSTDNSVRRRGYRYLFSSFATLVISTFFLIPFQLCGDAADQKASRFNPMIPLLLEDPYHLEQYFYSGKDGLSGISIEIENIEALKKNCAGNITLTLSLPSEDPVIEPIFDYASFPEPEIEIFGDKTIGQSFHVGDEGIVGIYRYSRTPEKKIYNTLCKLVI